MAKTCILWFLLLALPSLAGAQNVSSDVGPRTREPVGRGTTEAEWRLKPRMRSLAREILPPPYEQIKPIHTLMAQPKGGDWLASHDEWGESVKDYVRCDPIRPSRKLTTIYIKPVGEFSREQWEIVKLCAEYMRLFFNVPVRIEERTPLKIVPKRFRRIHWGNEQILTDWFLTHLLRPKRPKDAIAYLAFTSSDLWPRAGWNFVYGQASLRQRVGVWSIFRNGDPRKSKDMYKLCLRRTLKTGTHETGHMLTIGHCIAYRCNLNGCNNRQESDDTPLALCPICLYKICWNTRAKPIPRLTKLADFCKKHGLDKEEAFFRKSIRMMK